MRRAPECLSDEDLKRGLASDPASETHRRAVAEILDKYRTDLERYIAARLGVRLTDAPRDAEVQDLIHHLWLVLSERPRQVRHLKAYCYRVVKSELAKRKRQQGAVQSLDTLSDRDAVVALRSERPDIAVVFEEEEKRLADQLERLRELPDTGILELTNTQLELWELIWDIFLTHVDNDSRDRFRTFNAKLGRTLNPPVTGPAVGKRKARIMLRVHRNRLAIEREFDDPVLQRRAMVILECLFSSP